MFPPAPQSLPTSFLLFFVEGKGKNDWSQGSPSYDVALFLVADLFWSHSFRLPGVLSLWKVTLEFLQSDEENVVKYNSRKIKYNNSCNLYSYSFILLCDVARYFSAVFGEKSFSRHDETSETTSSNWQFFHSRPQCLRFWSCAEELWSRAWQLSRVTKFLTSFRLLINIHNDKPRIMLASFLRSPYGISPYGILAPIYYNV